MTAIVESIRDFTRKGADTKPFAVDGLRNAEWVAMDYSDILVHVFLPEIKGILQSGAPMGDAKLTSIPEPRLIKTYGQ